MTNTKEAIYQGVLYEPQGANEQSKPRLFVQVTGFQDNGIPRHEQLDDIAGFVMDKELGINVDNDTVSRVSKITRKLRGKSQKEAASEIASTPVYDTVDGLVVRVVQAIGEQTRQLQYEQRLSQTH